MAHLSNPVVKEAWINFGLMDKGNYTLTIYDITGKQLQLLSIKNDTENQKEKINMSEFAEGLYLFNITNTSTLKTKTIRIAKQK